MAVQYDARQLHCLKAMGIVPWVLRGDSTTELVDPDAATAPAVATAPENPVNGPGAGSVFRFSDDQAALASSLSSCRVTVIPRRGTSASESALKGRVILLLESKLTSAASVPTVGQVWDLDKHEEQLLSAMLRSIGLGENELCRTVPCSAAQTASTGEEASAGAAASIAELHRQVPRLVLLLLNRTEAGLPPAQHRLDASGGVVGWRLPHPAVLLANPERKREAWEVLKAIRQTLSPG